MMLFMLMVLLMMLMLILMIVVVRGRTWMVMGRVQREAAGPFVLLVTYMLALLTNGHGGHCPDHSHLQNMIKVVKENGCHWQGIKENDCV